MLPFIFYVRFSVDDGTGEALVWCHDVDSVPVLLGLPSAMWQQAKELLPSYGKVVYKYSREVQTQWQVASLLITNYSLLKSNKTNV